MDDVDPGFDTVRTTLQSALKIPFAVTVTSSQPFEGKTRLAVGTARAFAHAGFTTILVDANPANPSIGDALGVGVLPLIPLPLPPAGADPPPRYARNPDPDDDRLVAKLEKAGARIIGSVPTSFPERAWLARLSSLF